MYKKHGKFGFARRARIGRDLNVCCPLMYDMGPEVIQERKPCPYRESEYRTVSTLDLVATVQNQFTIAEVSSRRLLLHARTVWTPSAFNYGLVSHVVVIYGTVHYSTKGPLQRKTKPDFDYSKPIMRTLVQNSILHQSSIIFNTVQSAAPTVKTHRIAHERNYTFWNPFI